MTEQNNNFKEHMDAVKEVLAAAENFVDVKGRYHSELATNRLIEAVKQYRSFKE